MTTVTLGEFVFKNFEVPPSINFGGEQRLHVHELIGGQRIVDAMGKADSDISWSGIFTGFDSAERARFLDTLRVQGAPQILTYSNFRYNVLIKSFTAQFKETYIDYSISLEVIQDLTLPVTIVAPVGFDQAIQDAFILANDIAVLLANPSITSAMALLEIGINNIPNFSEATQAEINGLLANASNAQGAVFAFQNAINSALFG
jgi:hypothetical protein